MTAVFTSRFNPGSAEAAQRRAALQARLDALRALEERAAAASARSLPQFEKRGQLLPRQRVALLLDAGAPWLPLCTLAGYLQDVKDPEKSVPGGGMVAGVSDRFRKIYRNSREAAGKIREQQAVESP